MGNLVSFYADRKHVTVRIRNSCMPLLVVGLVQALAEMTYRILISKSRRICYS